ncbi:MAG: hypothetical protein JWM34_46 [Ilumatobacteraceae bacterium]|nr:hypothetical protein [Ilumatobacteraceae bacterium]
MRPWSRRLSVIVVAFAGAAAVAACSSDAHSPSVQTIDLGTISVTSVDFATSTTTGIGPGTSTAASVPLITVPAASDAPASSAATTAGAAAVDDSHLPVGDQDYADTPTRGAVMACRKQTGTAGAQAAGPWFNGDGTWDLSKKVFVQGNVKWDDASVTFTVNGDQRVVTSNGLPLDTTTGVFPVAADDPAASYDRNPNSITQQSLSFSIPATPTEASAATCVGGEVGIAINGVPIFNAFDAGGRDAGAWEVQDTCQGHPQDTGVYHYHSISSCLDTPGVNPSPLVGYAFDGFGIYGSRDAAGNQIHDADLDECHGTTSPVMWDGALVTMYHYVATHEFPYTVGCFRGTPTRQPG